MYSRDLIAEGRQIVLDKAPLEIFPYPTITRRCHISDCLAVRYPGVFRYRAYVYDDLYRVALLCIPNEIAQKGRGRWPHQGTMCLRPAGIGPRPG